MVDELDAERESTEVGIDELKTAADKSLERSISRRLWDFPYIG